MNLIEQVERASAHSKGKSDELGEVFTPGALIEQMLDALPIEDWCDPKKTWFDPCAGKGNFQAHVVTRLMVGLETSIPDEVKRYRHIMEKMIYMAEYQRESAKFIESTFNPTGKLKLNLYVGDSLSIPPDFWTVKWDERVKIWPQHYTSI
jgi:hypothetical protein